MLFSNDGPTEAEVDLGTHHQSVVPIQQIDDLEIQLPLTLTTPGPVRKASIDAGERRPPRGVEVRHVAEVLRVDQETRAVARRNQRATIVFCRDPGAECRGPWEAGRESSGRRDVHRTAELPSCDKTSRVRPVVVEREPSSVGVSIGNTVAGTLPTR